jgi:F0F1-type ATP synthase assembly protein I
MPSEDRSHFLARSLKTFQESVTQAGPAALAGYTLIGAILVLGTLGAALDKWLGTRPWCLVSGLALGIVVGFYGLIRTTWRR